MQYRIELEMVYRSLTLCVRRTFRATSLVHIYVLSDKLEHARTPVDGLTRDVKYKRELYKVDGIARRRSCEA